jgi:hypothetical protein
MTQLDARRATTPRIVAPGKAKRRPGARRPTLLSLEDRVEMVGAPDRPAWVSVGVKVSSDAAEAAHVHVAWHLDHDQDSVRMTIPEGRAFAAALLATCADLEFLASADGAPTTSPADGTTSRQSSRQPVESVADHRRVAIIGQRAQ